MADSEANGNSKDQLEASVSEQVNEISADEARSNLEQPNDVEEKTSSIKEDDVASQDQIAETVKDVAGEKSNGELEATEEQEKDTQVAEESPLKEQGSEITDKTSAAVIDGQGVGDNGGNDSEIQNGEKEEGEGEGHDEDTKGQVGDHEKPAVGVEDPVVQVEADQKPVGDQDKPVVEVVDQDKPVVEEDATMTPADEVDSAVDLKTNVKDKDNKNVGVSETGDLVGSGVDLATAPLEDILEEEEEEEEEQEPIDRDELVATTKEVLLEQERMKSLSSQLQHKIAEYLAKKKTEERPDPGRNVTDQEKRYTQCMAAVEALEMELNTMQQRSELQEAQLKVLREQKLAEVQKAIDEFASYKKAIAITAVHSRTGKRLQAQEVEQFKTAEDNKELELIQVRLENIKLQNKISKLEAQIKEKEQLAEGLHMIDFEQLKINNVDLNEKIEERNEDILKLRKKVTSTVQVLTHVKEKLQFLQAENAEKRTALRNVDEIVAKKRDHLTRTKQARDALRVDNLRLKQKGGLVSHPSLLGDFEERKDQNDDLKLHLEKLQQRHSELTVVCDGLRKKVEQARTIQPRNI